VWTVIVKLLVNTLLLPWRIVIRTLTFSVLSRARTWAPLCVKLKPTRFVVPGGSVKLAVPIVSGFDLLAAAAAADGTIAVAVTVTPQVAPP
jgi:hypothetical protein